MPSLINLLLCPKFEFFLDILLQNIGFRSIAKHVSRNGAKAQERLLQSLNLCLEVFSFVGYSMNFSAVPQSCSKKWIAVGCPFIKMVFSPKSIRTSNPEDVSMLLMRLLALVLRRRLRKPSFRQFH